MIAETSGGLRRLLTSPSQNQQDSVERWALYAAKVFLAAWALFYLAQAVRASFWFDGVPDDGPFQIFDPLRRMAAGQVGGRDFVFFHGIGVPYLHYPLFALFGRTLIASELSRQLVSFTLFALTLAAFVKATLRGTSRIWIGAAVAVLFMEATFPGSAAPGHSLESGRSAWPIFAFAVLQLPIGGWVKAMLSGLCIAVSFVCGTEHGISLALAFIFLSGVTITQSLFASRTNGGSGWLNLRFASIALATAAAFSAIVLFLLCGIDGTLKALHYNLVDLPANQFWFFGSPPLPYLGSWRELISDRHVILCLLPFYFTLGVLVFFLFKCWKSPLRLGQDWQALAVLMLIYGLLTGIPLLGMLSRHYVFPLTRILALTGLLVYANLGEARLTILPTLAGRPTLAGWRTAASVLFMAVCAVAALAYAISSTVSTAALVRHLRSNSAAYSRFLDNRWDQFMADGTHVIDANRKRSNVSLWSVYSAMLEEHYGIFLPADDYIIHTMGGERWRHYLDTLERINPEFVQTRTHTFDFEEWQENERWEFFEAVLDNYTPLKTVKHALIWQRTGAPWRQPSTDFQTVELSADRHSVVLPGVTGQDRIGVARVRYHVTNRWGRLPLIGKTPRFLALIEGSPRHLPISFPPDQPEFEFPVQFHDGLPITLRFRTDSLLPGAAFDVDQVQIKVLPWEASQSAIYAREKSGKGINPEELGPAEKLDAR